MASLRGLDAPMDLANAIRGNDLFTDFYDEEENVRKLLEFCTKAGRWTTEHQFEAVGQAEGGTITGLGIWIPGHGIGHLSEDTSSMCSMEMYREFGEPYTRKLLMDYDSALFHMHAMGRHILPAIAAMDKVKVIEISCDPNQPAPIEVYKEYADVLENKTVFIKMTRQQIEDNLNFLAARKTIIEYQAYTKEDADYICDILAPLRDFT